MQPFSLFSFVLVPFFLTQIQGIPFFGWNARDSQAVCDRVKESLSSYAEALGLLKIIEEDTGFAFLLNGQAEAEVRDSLRRVHLLLRKVERLNKDEKETFRHLFIQERLEWLREEIADLEDSVKAATASNTNTVKSKPEDPWLFGFDWKDLTPRTKLALRELEFWQAAIQDMLKTFLESRCTKRTWKEFLPWA